MHILHVALDSCAPLAVAEFEIDVLTAPAACAERLRARSYDAVVIDLIDHAEVLALVQELGGHGVPIVVIVDDDALAVRAIELGATDYVRRGPELARALGGRVRAAIARPTAGPASDAAEERFRSLFEHSPICQWEEDGSELKRHLDQLRADGVRDFRSYFHDHPAELGRCVGMVRVLDVNQAAVRDYEARDKAELIAGLARSMTPESRAVFRDEIIALAEGQTMFEAETIDQTFTGRRKHILMKTLVAPGSEHTLSRVYVSIVDLSARHLAEERARKLAAFPELAPTAMLELTAAGALVYANPASHAIARLVGGEVEHLLPANIAEIVRDVLTTGRPPAPLDTRHGARTLSWSFQPVDAQHTVHCYASDITDRLLLEEQLRQSQKMDAVGHLAGGVAHDFNNLLTVIHGNTALLQRGKSMFGELRADALDGIAQAADRATDLVRQLLMFSRQHELRKRELDVNALIVNVMTMLERVVREDIQVALELSPRSLHVHGDAGMLDQVVMNLVVNARDAMPDGGRLVLATSEVTVPGDNHALYPDLRPGGYAAVRVTDSGHGIAADNLAHIFEPFFTTKEAGKGTGLGLATVFGIVKQHGGGLVVTSEVGRGTTVTALLPAIALAEQVAAPLVVVPVDPLGGHESILVVEDEAPVRRLIQQVLELHGYSVRVVSTGADALALGMFSDARFDLVLTDVIMPGGVSGRELAERLRASKRNLKVIYMSGYAGELAGRGLELREGVNFLQKPFGPTPLLACVRFSLDGA